MPTIRRFLDGCTNHVSLQTASWLDEQGELAANYQPGADVEHPAIHIGKHVYGWFFYADEEPSEDWPEDIRRLMIEARKHGCEYVMLDADGPEIEALPTYDWDTSTTGPEFDPAPYRAAGEAAGFIVVENHVVNVGFYWRPDDCLPFTPVDVFPTAGEAWRNCCEVNDLTVAQ